MKIPKEIPCVDQWNRQFFIIVKTESQSPTFIKEMGVYLRTRREMARISQKDLSDLTGLSVHTISDIESGKGNPTIEVLLRLFECLGLKIVFEPGNLQPPEFNQ